MLFSISKRKPGIPINRTMMKITQTILAILLSLNMALTQNDTIYTFADQMPYFAGCQEFNDDIQAKKGCSNRNLIHFIAHNLEYPEEAKVAEIEGIVYVSFVIDEQGRVIKPAVLMDIGGGCGESALAVLDKMPNWQPGVQDGKNVKVKLNLPIQFSLKKDAETVAATGYNLTWGHLKGTTLSAKDLQAYINDGVNVRDPFGNETVVREITFIFEKKNKVVSAKSRDGVSEELKKIAQKAKAGGIFTIQANVQEKGKFVLVKRSFQIID